MKKAIIFFLTTLLLLQLIPPAQAIFYYVDNPSPADNASEIRYDTNATTCVDIDPPDACTMNLTFKENSSGSYVTYQTYTNISKGTYCGNFSIECGTNYYWQVSAYIDCPGDNDFWENHTYNFTSVDCPVSHVVPSNNSIGHCPCCICLCAKLTNLSGGTVKFAFQTNESGSWQNIEDTRVVPANDSYCLCIPDFVWFNYTYYWRVVYAVEGGDMNYSDVFRFTTAENESDCPCGGEAMVEYFEENGGGRGEMLDTPGFEFLCFMTSFVLLCVMIYRSKRQKQQ